MADYCTDVFKMVEDTDDSFRMWQGLVGPYYVPIMSNDGTLRWTNNGGLPNPSEVNLMGPQGAGIRIAGIRESAEELPATAPAGDIWLVGEGSPYEGYSYTGGEWLDLGPLTVGPAGPPGPQGDDYELTEADKQEIAEISEGLFLAELDNDPLAIRYGGTGAHDLAEAKENLGIGDIEDKLGTWPLGTDAQDVAGAINEMIGEIALQVADIEQLKDNFAGEFSPTSTYTVGQYVTYGGKFYRCTTAVTTAGSWADANWTQVTAGGELQAKASKSGNNITNPEIWRSALSFNAINNIGSVDTGGLRIDFLNGTEQYYMPFYAGASENNKITLFDKNWNVVWKIPKDYKANDTFYVGSSLVLTGLIGNTAATTVYLDCVVDKSLENISTISVTTMSGYIAGANGRDSSGTTDYTGSGYSIACTKQGNHHVRIAITKSSAFTMGNAFTPVTFFGPLTLSFT